MESSRPPWASLLLALAWTGTTLALSDTWSQVRLGAVSRPLLEAGEWWRLFSAAFVQPGWLGLGLALYSLVAVVLPLERKYGGRAVLGLAGMTAPVCGLVAAFLEPVQVVMLGPSVLLSLLGASVVGSDRRGVALAESIPAALFCGLLGVRGELNLAALAAGLAFGAGLGMVFAGTRRFWSSFSIVLLLSGAAAAQYGLSHPRMESYQPRTYTDPGRHYRFRFPSFLKEVEAGQHFVLLGPGFTLEAATMDEGRPIDVRAEAERMVARFAKGGGGVEVGRHEVIERSGRVWLTVDTRLDRVTGRMGFTSQGTRIYRLTLTSSARDAEQARTVLDQVMNSFDILDAAAPQASPTPLASDTAQGQYAQGSSLMAARKFAEAEQAFTKALKIDPDLAEAHLSRALARLALRKLEEALQDVDVAVERNPMDYRAVLLRGRVRAELKSYEKARQDFDRVLDLGSGNKALEVTAFRERAGVRLELGDEHGAEADLLAALEREPGDPEANYRLGTLLDRQGRDPRKPFAVFLQAAPGDPRAKEVRELLEK
ncbi:MAG: rhomboid family intramembrane serine protease [Candidatus Eremiobacterota bacterium]